jgi:hypothetical protein
VVFGIKYFQRSKISIERQHKKISENYKNADISELKVSNRALRFFLSKSFLFDFIIFEQVTDRLEAIICVIFGKI